MRRWIALALAALTVAACEGTPFNPYGKVEQDWCHPEKWLDQGWRYQQPAAVQDSLAAYQARCRDEQQAKNSQ